MSDFCPKCFTRADACADCTQAEIAALKKRVQELETENTQLRDHLYLLNVLQESK